MKSADKDRIRMALEFVRKAQNIVKDVTFDDYANLLEDEEYKLEDIANSMNEVISAFKGVL